MPSSTKKQRKFGVGGGVNIVHGGKGQINKQTTRAGSIYGQQKEVPNINLNKYIGKKEGGTVKHDDLQEDKKLIKRAFGMHDKQLHESKKTDLSKLKKGGTIMDKEPRRSVKGEHAVQKKSKRGAEIVKMARGGGVEVKGKTKGKFITMCGGGMSKGKK